mgnify:CR=1
MTGSDPVGSVLMSTVKRCHLCWEDKPRERFNRSAVNRGGLDHRCRDCINSIRRYRTVHDLAFRARRHASCARARRRRTLTARAYVKAVREQTVCVRCGDKPVDFHHETHPSNPRTRILMRVQRGEAIAKIAAEIARCTALCRRCHMIVDGRLPRLIAAGIPWRQQTIAPRPCIACAKLAKPRRRGFCNACYQRRVKLSA